MPANGVIAASPRLLRHLWEEKRIGAGCIVLYPNEMGEIL